MQLINLLKIKKNTKSKILTYNTKYNFAKLKNIDDIKKLSLDSMFDLMKDHHKKFVELNKLVPQTKDIYNIYKSMTFTTKI